MNVRVRVRARVRARAHACVVEKEIDWEGCTLFHVELLQVHIMGTRPMGKLKRPWAGNNMADQFKKMQSQMNNMNREAKGLKKREKANARRANNKLKARGKK